MPRKSTYAYKKKTVKRILFRADTVPVVAGECLSDALAAACQRVTDDEVDGIHWHYLQTISHNGELIVLAYINAKQSGDDAPSGDSE